MRARGFSFVISAGISIACASSAHSAASQSQSPLQPSAIYGGFQHSRIYVPHGQAAFADEAFDFKLGKKKPEVLWRKPEAALGPPDFTDYEADRVSEVPHFLCLGSNGSVIFRFAHSALIDGPGPDLYIFEPNVAHSNKIMLEISRDGKSWTKVGEWQQTAREIDISKFAKAGEVYNYIRITDASAIDDADPWPGANIDAVAALNSALKISIEDKLLFDSSDKLKAEAAGELKRVQDLWENVNGNKLLIEVYGEHGSKANSTESALNRQAEEAKAWLVKEAKIPADKISIKTFLDARSIASRDVAREREKDSRIDFIVVLQNRDTINSGITRPIEFIDGRWDSNLGPVIISARTNPKTHQTTISGEWVEVPTRVAIIQDGTYNPSTGELTLTWFRQTNNVHGTGSLHLGADVNRLRGKWQCEDGKTNEWRLERPIGSAK